MPATLSAEAKEEWRRVVPELDDMGVLATVDRGLHWVELEGLLQKSGKLIRCQKGNLVRNPIWLLRRDADETVTELARQLGLSPTARLRAGVVHQRPPDPHEEERRDAAIQAYRDRLEEDPRRVLYLQQQQREEGA
jgi:P27 family predicted phage terminase small subunit